MRNFTALIVLIGFGVIFETSCRKPHCAEAPNYYYKIDTAFSSRIPYHPYDTQRFLKNGIDTVIFIGLNKATGYLGPDDKLGGECIYEHDYYQWWAIDYKSINQEDNMRIEIDANGAGGSTGLTYLHYSIQGETFELAQGELRPPFYERTINGIKYTDLHKIIRRSDYGDTLYNYTYYSVSKGIVDFHSKKQGAYQRIP